MTSYLIDSDVMIDFFNKRQNATILLTKFLSESVVSISVLTLMELRAGWNKKQRDIYFPLLLDLFSFEDVTGEIAELAGVLRFDYKHKGIILPGIDCLIAATSIVGNYTLVTNNVSDYPIKELSIFNPHKTRN